MARNGNIFCASENLHKNNPSDCHSCNKNIHAQKYSRHQFLKPININVSINSQLLQASTSRFLSTAALISFCASLESNSKMKKTRGRRKIEMKKIDSKKNLQVTLTKRRKGLFAKAGELASLCGSWIAILVQSPGDKISAFGYPSVESVIHNYESAGNYYSYTSPLEGFNITDVKNGYFVAMARLEEQKRIESAAKGGDAKFWWDEEIEGMELYELEEYVEELEKLRERVKAREMEVAKESKKQCLASHSDSVGLPSQNMGLHLDAFLDCFMKTYHVENDAQAEEEETGGGFWHFDDDDLWGWKTTS